MYKIEFDSLHIVFENCDSVIVPAEFISRVYLKNLRSEFGISHDSWFSLTYRCDDAEIELEDEAWELKTEFWKYSGSDDEIFKNRIKRWADITSFYFYKDDEVMMYVEPPYSDTFYISDINHYQVLTKSNWSENKVISIAKKNLIKTRSEYIKTGGKILPERTRIFYNRIRWISNKLKKLMRK